MPPCDVIDALGVEEIRAQKVRVLSRIEHWLASSQVRVLSVASCPGSFLRAAGPPPLDLGLYARGDEIVIVGHDRTTGLPSNRAMHNSNTGRDARWRASGGRA